MERLHLFFKKIWIKIFGLLLIAILSYAATNISEEKEQVLGFFKLGETLDKVEEKLGETDKDHWGFLVDEDNKTIKGISYREMNIRDNYDYPKTSKGISIGSTLGEVEKIYGPPQKKLSGRSWFVLRNSELSMEYIYLHKGIWITFINQQPYSDTRNWRAVNIAIGNLIKDILIGAPAYATWFLTEDKKDSIIKAYVKKYGKRKDLEIYDYYTLNREIDYLEYIRSKGEYLVTSLMILPKERGSKLLPVIFNENSRFWQNTQRLAKKQTAVKYNISFELLERIIKKVEYFKTTSAYEKIVELD